MDAKVKGDRRSRDIAFVNFNVTAGLGILVWTFFVETEQVVSRPHTSFSLEYKTALPLYIR
jgi:hypothetical protein